MDSKQFYKETFDSIQMSEESIRKVKNMSEDNKKRRQLKNGFRAAIAAASLVAVFAIGNVAVYAATGSSLVEKAAEKISVYINGEKADVDNITKDFEDGKAEGSVIYNWMPYLYKVSGTTEKYNITLEYLTVGYTEKPSIK